MDLTQTTPKLIDYLRVCVRVVARILTVLGDQIHKHCHCHSQTTCRNFEKVKSRIIDDSNIHD
jgi:hypothetical protein